MKRDIAASVLHLVILDLEAALKDVVAEELGILMKLHGRTVLQSQEAHLDDQSQSQSQNLDATKFECGMCVDRKVWTNFIP